MTDEVTTETAETEAVDAGQAVEAPKAAPLAADAGAAERPEPEPQAEAPFWPEDWRERLAEHVAPGNKKEREKELRRLSRLSGPEAAWGAYRDMETRWAQNGLVKIPGENATEDDWKAYNKAIGVPEKPSAYIDGLKLANGAELGDDDRAWAEPLAERLHKAGAPASAFNEMMNWYVEAKEQMAAEQDDHDESHRATALKELKAEYGPSFKRITNAISTLFAESPGGADINNPNSTISRVLGARTPDGVILGDDPSFYRFLASIAKERGLGITEVEVGDEGGKAIDTEISEIEMLMRTDRRAYNKDVAKQERLKELYEARQRVAARNKRAA